MNASVLQEDCLIVRETLGERRFGSIDLPIAFGGSGSQILLAGRPAGPQAWIGMHEDQLFVQPADQAEVLHNGVPITRSTWLKPGDVVNLGAARLRIGDDGGLPAIEVDDGTTGNITAPPIITDQSRLHGASDEEAEPMTAVCSRGVRP